MRKMVAAAVAVSLTAVLLTGCAENGRREETAETSEVMETAAEREEQPVLPESSVEDADRASEESPEFRAAEDIVSVTMVDVMYQGGPNWGTYEEMAARPGAKVTEQEGVYAGSPVIWSTIEEDDFVCFFVRLQGEPESANENTNYAILGEDIGLSCGIHVGMTAAEAEALLPGLYRYAWDEEKQSSVYNWNCSTYPEGWCEQYAAVLVARVENEVDMPYCIGLMLDDQDVIRAISFCWVTAG